MVTKTRKQKRRNQRGGKTIQIKSRNLGRNKITYNPPEGTTMRKLVEHYFNSVGIGPQGKLGEMLFNTLEKENPYINVFSGNKQINLKGKWNKPFVFENDFQTFEIWAHTHYLLQKIEQQKTQHVLKYILELMSKLRGGKIIWGSSTATRVIEKNVAQQFMFGKEPQMPIIHIDAGFFTPEHEPYEFYTLLNFDEKPTVGTREFVRHYTKPQGKSLTLRSKNPSEYEKEYFEEVLNQANNRFNLNNQMDIYCVNYWYTEETQNIIKEHAAKTGFRVYTWSQ